MKLLLVILSVIALIACAPQTTVPTQQEVATAVPTFSLQPSPTTLPSTPTDAPTPEATYKPGDSGLFISTVFGGEFIEAGYPKGVEEEAGERYTSFLFDRAADDFIVEWNRVGSPQSIAIGVVMFFYTQDQFTEPAIGATFVMFDGLGQAVQADILVEGQRVYPPPPVNLVLPDDPQDWEWELSPGCAVGEHFEDDATGDLMFVVRCVLGEGPTAMQ